MSEEPRKLLSVSYIEPIRLCDGGEVAISEVLCGYEDVVESAAHNEDGRTIVSGSAHRTVRFWDVDSPRTAINESF